jgi:ankyrin repeat protein
MAKNTEKTLVNAIYSGNLEYLRTLNISKLNEVMKNGYSPLALAISEGQFDVVEFMRNRGVTVDVSPCE